jgi:simple sugar transport system permease protein
MKRILNATWRDMVLTNFAAIVAGIVLSGALLLFLGIDPIFVFSTSIRAILTDGYTAADILLKATPLIMTALAFAFTYKANLFNIGAQGQFYMGAIAAIWLSLELQNRIPTALLLLIVLIGALAAGALIGGLIGFLKARFDSNEFLVSMMSSYVVLALMNYLLRTFLKETKGEYPQTDPIARSAWLPNLIKGTRLHYGFIISVLFAVLIWVLLYKTTLGFRIRAVGQNSRASALSGISPTKIYVIAFLISGALAGVAGFTEMNGVQHMLIQDFNPEMGAAGLGIAILANANPIGIIFASILYGALNVIGTQMGRIPGANVPSSIVSLMQGFVMLFVIMAYYARTKIASRREKNKRKREAALS